LKKSVSAEAWTAPHKINRLAMTMRFMTLSPSNPMVAARLAAHRGRFTE
jgi:hypothetical protein